MIDLFSLKTTWANISYQAGQRLLRLRSQADRKVMGQYLTPPLVADYMAQQLGFIQDGSLILDPAVGAGTLLCALIDHLIDIGQPCRVELHGCDIDPVLCDLGRKTLEAAAVNAAEHGIQITIRIWTGDFVLDALQTVLQPSLFDLAEPNALARSYDAILANPPYFKLRADDLRSVSGKVFSAGYPNIYTLFMALGAHMLTVEGRACFIVPRSFCSGAYFAAFRQEFLNTVHLERIHLFEARNEAFSEDEVLQETLILGFSRVKQKPSEVKLSVSQNTADLTQTSHRSIPLEHLARKRHNALYLYLPTEPLDEPIMEVVDGWSGSLHDFGLEVSTGPVVAFRARPWLSDQPGLGRVPLLWMQHIRGQTLTWPLTSGARGRSQWIHDCPDSRSLLIPTENYVLSRRFSTKEEARRLVAAPVLKNSFNDGWIGIENHLNYIHRPGSVLTSEESVGISALYNTRLLDRYFRISNGNTQVNAGELRTIPLPPLSVIHEIGQRVLSDANVETEQLVYTVLNEAGCLPSILSATLIARHE